MARDGDHVYVASLAERYTDEILPPNLPKVEWLSSRRITKLAILPDGTLSKQPVATCDVDVVPENDPHTASIIAEGNFVYTVNMRKYPTKVVKTDMTTCTSVQGIGIEEAPPILVPFG